jgi:hypothetical protein
VDLKEEISRRKYHTNKFLPLNVVNNELFNNDVSINIIGSSIPGIPGIPYI